MMDYSGEAAEQVVRMSLNGVEVAARISGRAAERLAVLLYAVLRDQQKTRGKIRLTNMLKSGKELKVFAVKDNELQKFCEEAKKYGVLYCVLKDTKADDGLTDIMVRAEDASKINRIFERFKLATIDMASVKTEIQRFRDAKAQDSEDISQPEKTKSVDEKLDEFLDTVVTQKEDQAVERPESPNPTTAQTAKSRQSGPSSGTKASRNDAGGSERSDPLSRPSVKEEMRKIRSEQRKKSSEGTRERATEHTRRIVKKKTDKEVTP